MKVFTHTLVYCFFFLFLLPQAFSQFYFFGSGSDQARPCPWDPSQNMLTSPNWDVYQTHNDLWDGPIDSSRCITFSTSEINLADIDPAKPFFVRYRMPSPNFHVLWPNQLYITTYHAPVLSGNSTFLLADSTCPDLQCTGLKMGIEIPDSLGTGTDSRWYHGNFAGDPFTQQIGFCFPSEKFVTQVVNTLVFRFQIDRYDASSKLTVPQVDIFESFFFHSITQLTTNYTPGTSPFIRFQDANMMLHADSTYPTINNPFYIDVGLQPNPNKQETIYLYIEPFSYLTGQPFTELRGDTIAGGSGLRHQVIVVNQGGTMCFFAMELVFRQGNGFRHESGQLTFQDPTGCMAFHAGSFLEVASGETLNYGQTGLGVIMLQEGAEIRIEQGATLNVANRLVLDAVSSDGNVHIYLPTGRKLSFDKSARIQVGGKSANPDAKLIVHLRGGVLDDSQLPPSSKQRIVKLEESSFSRLFEDAAIRYDKGQPFVSFFVDKSMPVELGVYDTQGRLIGKNEYSLQPGQQLLAIPSEQLQPGVYLIRLGNGSAFKGISFLRL